MSRINTYQGPDWDTAVVAGARCRMAPDGGPTYDRIQINSNLPGDEFLFFIEVGGDRRVELTGTDILEIAGYDNHGATADHYILDFADTFAKIFQGELVTGFVTQPDERIVFGLDVAGVVTPGVPTAEMYFKTSPNRPEEFRYYILPENVPINKIGRNDFGGLRRGRIPGDIVVRRMFVYGDITHMSIKRDDKMIYGEGELPLAINTADLVHEGKVIPVSDTCFVYDPIVNGNVIKDPLDTFHLRHLEARFTTTTTDNLRAVTQYVQDMRPADQRKLSRLAF